MSSPLPTIGIRPAIDGRRQGVREALDDQTMRMAQNAARLIESSLRHASGEPVKCVIADTCIGGVTESARADAKFRAHNVGLTLTVTPCWCYGAETIDMDPQRPKAIWGFNGTARPGAVYLAAALAAHNQKGLPAYSIYGREVQEPGDETIPADVSEKILRFVRAGLAVATMRGKTYLSLGGCSMGIVGSIVDQDFMESYLGLRVQAVDMVELRRRMDRGIYDPAEFKRAMQWVDAKFRMGPDINPPERRRSPESARKVLEESILMALIMRDMMHGNPALDALGFGEEALGYNAITGGFQGQRHWTDHYANGDTAEAILNSSFDWNGVRPSIPFATENDSLNAIDQLFGFLLTGTAQIFADVRTYWSPESVQKATGHRLTGVAANGLIHMINSGPAALDGTCRMKDTQGRPTMKPHWEITPEDAEKCLGATEWCPAVDEYFRGGGYSTRWRTLGGVPFTMHRINIVKGVGPVLQIAEGWSVDLPDAVHDALDNRTNATWPTTWFVPRTTGTGPFTDIYSVMANWGSNHGVLTHGHVGADLITLASMLRIPVCMHNVPESALFRPSAWLGHGMDAEGADYRACSNYGPLYGKY